MFSLESAANIYIYMEYIIPLFLVLLLIAYMYYDSFVDKRAYVKEAKAHMNSCASCRKKGFHQYHATSAFDGHSYYQTRCQAGGSIISLKWYGNGKQYISKK